MFIEMDNERSQMGKMLRKYLGFCRSKHTRSSTKHSPTVIEELCHHFSLADLRKSTNNFDKNRIIGRGGYGDVYKGCLKRNGATDYSIVLKRMKGISDKEGVLYFKKEIELLCQLDHPNLVSLIGFCDHKKEKIIVYEYMSNGSLEDYLYRKEKEPLSWKKRLEICIGAAHGLHYLHTGAKRTIFHCDIKPSNMLLDNNMVPKLSDFGRSLQGPLFLSKPKPIQVDRIIGTFGYMAPEYCQFGSLTDKCDVYSFGMVLLEVVCKENLKSIYNSGLEEPAASAVPLYEFAQRFPAEKIINPILMGKIAPECWEVFSDIIERCLRIEPNERPAMGEVEVELEHALALQEEADARKTSGDYSLLLSTPIIKPQQDSVPISAWNDIDGCSNSSSDSCETIYLSEFENQ